ncbi:hypothetical protein J4214_03555 [Candidatus Woesearchaeota archaeon]|nr:hypothetical protein [Candidatus Woesearchaeota archaeon]
MSSPLVRAVDFFRDFGIFDVVLPFLLVFTIVYAILEKTRILGVEKTKDDEKGIPNKNLNAMVAFVIGLLVVAASNIVGIINESLPNIVLLLVVSISFLLLIGAFMQTGEMDFPGKHPRWYTFFVIVMFVGTVLIFLGAIRDDKGKSFLTKTYDYIINNFDSAIFASIVIVIIIVVMIFVITRSPKLSGSQDEKKGG